MAEFGLSDAVTSLSQHISATATLWGIYAAATFTASGFGISMGDRFTVPIAIFLTLGFLSFTIGHWVLVRNNIKAQDRISQDIRQHLKDDGDLTSYDDSIAAICGTTGSLRVSRAAHVVIDACVLAIVWLTVAPGLVNWLPGHRWWGV